MEKSDSRKGENSLSILSTKSSGVRRTGRSTQIERERDPQQFSCRTNLFLKTPFIIVAFNIEHHNSFSVVSMSCVTWKFILLLKREKASSRSFLFQFFPSKSILTKITKPRDKTSRSSPKLFPLENFCNQSMNETQTIWKKNFLFSRRRTSQFSVS